MHFLEQNKHRTPPNTLMAFHRVYPPSEQLIYTAAGYIKKTVNKEEKENMDRKKRDEERVC